jgi:hypothetical protein
MYYNRVFFYHNAVTRKMLLGSSWVVKLFSTAPTQDYKKRETLI